jgi:hypothetical protein
LAPRIQEQIAVTHLRAGWVALACFATAGLVLEGLHGFKVAMYLDPVGTRRLMWTLAHAHGTLLGLVNIAFAVSLPRLTWPTARRDVASACLRAATLLIPSGFFLGGAYPHGADPGVGVVLVPVGGIALVVALALSALSVTRSP